MTKTGRVNVKVVPIFSILIQHTSLQKRHMFEKPSSLYTFSSATSNYVIAYCSKLNHVVMFWTIWY